MAISSKQTDISSWGRNHSNNLSPPADATQPPPMLCRLKKSKLSPTTNCDYDEQKKKAAYENAKNDTNDNTRKDHPACTPSMKTWGTPKGPGPGLENSGKRVTK